MSELTIIEICSIVLAKFGFPNETLVSLLAKWKSFVEECADGYGWEYSEYRNEIRSRFLIQQLLDDERIASNEELQDLFIEIKDTDELFRSLLQDGCVIEGESWWDQGVLKKAGEEYRSYMKDGYGITLVMFDD